MFLLNKQHDFWIKFLFTLSGAILIMTICGWIFNNNNEIKCIKPILNLGKKSYFMYLNEGFIIACMLAEQHKVLLKVFVIILSYGLAFLFEMIYKKIL